MILPNRFCNVISFGCSGRRTYPADLLLRPFGFSVELLPMKSGWICALWVSFDLLCGRRHCRGRFGICSVLFCWSLVPGTEHFPASAAAQPQWGQAWSRNMLSAEKGLPGSFDPRTGKNIKWTAQLGTETHSTPVIAGGRVYIGTNNGQPRDPKYQGDRGVLMCFDEKTGRFLWQLVVPKREEDVYFDWPNTGMASPVTVEGGRVYVVSNRGEVLCLDPNAAADGSPGVI